MKAKTKEAPEKNNKILMQNIPEIVQDLADLIGQILDSKGLMRDLKEEVQHEFSARVMNQLSGMSIYFPKGRLGLAQRQCEAIREQYEADKTITAICREFGVTASYVYRIIAGEK